MGKGRFSGFFGRFGGCWNWPLWLSMNGCEKSVTTNKMGQVGDGEDKEGWWGELGRTVY